MDSTLNVFLLGGVFLPCYHGLDFRHELTIGEFNQSINQSINQSSDNSLLKPTGIQIATKFLPGLTTREHRTLVFASRRCLWVRTKVYTVWSAAILSESESQATDLTLPDV